MCEFRFREADAYGSRIADYGSSTAFAGRASLQRSHAPQIYCFLRWLAIRNPPFVSCWCALMHIHF